MASYYVSQGGSRILNATRVDQSGADNTNVTGWTKTDDFIIAININSNGKDTEAAQYKLRWRNKTDGGSFADVGAATEINYNATTDLVNGTGIDVGGRKCDSQGGDTWQSGEEVEGASLSDSIDLADEYETEVHFALDCSGATDAKEYEFELYDSTLGITRGTCGATITMESSPSNLAGWPYWKVVSITGQAGAGTDYQTKITIGDSAGGDFHLEGHCTNFPQDIQITDDDGTTLLDHWVEDLTADPIVVHVEVKDDLGSNRDIRIYYGKSGETTASNGANTFIQYHGAASAGFIDSLVVPYQDVVYQAKVKTTSALHNINYGLGTSLVDEPTHGAFLKSYTYASLSDVYSIARDAGGGTIRTTQPALLNGNDYDLRIVTSSTDMKHYVDDVQRGATITTNLPDSNMGLYFHIQADTATQYWSFARKYNSPEPAFSSAGAEQTPGGVAPTGVFYGPLIGPFGGPL